eukprot:TRINITY_DN20400_c0_g1_i1.p2 TRINITY_DN20400_c0_g1~~TRINITY_DN20400_c0_g1_i1.p2  ORF type:complete len:389 (+),score=138.62 TRINITY_DN20400_c0_g1_i1:101-1267(+)
MFRRAACPAAAQQARWGTYVRRKPRVALFVDIENVNVSNLLNVRSTLVTMGSLKLQKCYGPRQPASMAAAATVGMEYIVVEKQPEAVDVRLAFDVAQLVLHDGDAIDAVAVVAGDTDYGELVQWVRGKGKYVYGFSTFETTNRMYKETLDRYFLVHDGKDMTEDMPLDPSIDPSACDKAARPWRPKPRADDADPLFERFYMAQGRRGTGAGEFVAELPPLPQKAAGAAEGAAAAPSAAPAAQPKADKPASSGSAQTASNNSSDSNNSSSSSTSTSTNRSSSSSGGGGGIPLGTMKADAFPLPQEKKPRKPTAAELQAAKDEERFALAKHLHTKLAQMDEDVQQEAAADPPAAPQPAPAAKPRPKPRQADPAPPKKDSFDNLWNLSSPV